MISSPQDLVNLLATHFAATSSDENYDIHFQNLKIQVECHPIDFDAHDDYLTAFLSP